MGSTKSLRYEVLVYPPKEKLSQPPNVMASSNSFSQQFVLQTQARRFSCDRENMQQYWIPDGFRPVLVHRDMLNFSFAATNDVNDSRQMTSTASAGNVPNFNALPLKQKTTATISNTHRSKQDDHHNGTVLDAHRSKRRRRVLGSSKGQVAVHPRISQRTFDATALYYKVKCKELMANGIIPNPPVDPPSKIIGKMWYEEPESIKRYYEILAHRIKIDQDLKRSKNPTYQLNDINQSHVNERSTIQQFPGVAVSSATSEHRHSNIYNNVSQTSSGDFSQYHVPLKSVISRDPSSDKFFAEQHQNSPPQPKREL